MRTNKFCCLLIGVLFTAIPLWSQGTSDFVGRFMQINKPSASDVRCITVGPRMVEKMMRLPEEQDNTASARIKDILEGCKSIRILKVQDQAPQYREKMLSLLEKNKKRYVPYNEPGTAPADSESRLWVRRRGKNIVEVIILSPEDENRFSVLNLTGSMDSDFIERLITL